MASQQPKPRVLLICQDRMGSTMAGPAIRYLKFAQGLADAYDVTLLLCQPPEAEFNVPGVRLVVCGDTLPLTHRTLSRTACDFDVVVTQPLRIDLARSLARSSARVIYDTYVPTLVESLSLQAYEDAPLDARQEVYTKYRLQIEAALRTGDTFLSASSKQRDFLMGSLAALGRLDVGGFVDDPGFNSLATVVPFGLESERPVKNGIGIRDRVDGIEADDTVLLWAGGVWNWLDPLTVIEAVHRARASNPRIKLFFLGVKHPSPLFQEMQMTREAIELARSLGEEGTGVHFNFEWVPYDERHNYLLDADIGVAGHFASVETDYSFRTRILDHLWCNLPTISTRGGFLSDLIEDQDLGVTVAERDVEGWTHAINELASDDARRARMRNNIDQVRAAYEWPAVVTRLKSAIDSTLEHAPRESMSLRPLSLSYLRASMRVHVALHGRRSLLRRGYALLR